MNFGLKFASNLNILMNQTGVGLKFKRIDKYEIIEQIGEGLVNSSYFTFPELTV